MRGLVVATTGNGSIHQALAAALQRAQAAGVAVLRASRCAFGGIVEAAAASPGERGGARRVDAAGPADFDSAGMLTPAQARLKLLLQLAAG